MKRRGESECFFLLLLSATLVVLSLTTTRQLLLSSMHEVLKDTSVQHCISLSLSLPDDRKLCHSLFLSLYLRPCLDTRVREPHERLERKDKSQIHKQWFRLHYTHSLSKRKRHSLLMLLLLLLLLLSKELNERQRERRLERPRSALQGTREREAKKSLGGRRRSRGTGGKMMGLL